MILILVFASIFPYQVLGDPSPIVGGQFSKVEDYPWLASIQKNGYHMCVGSIISAVILTAAHCVFDCTANSLIVRVGSSRTDSGGTWHRVVSILTHEENGYFVTGHAIYLNDLALLKVLGPFQFGSNVAQVRLATDRTRVIAGRNVFSNI